MPVPTKSRGWCFTVNNYTERDTERLIALKFQVKYIVVGKEIGESGTPHYQGYMKIKHPISFNRAKTLLPQGAHIEFQRGSDVQAMEYCLKDGDILIEEGDKPISKQTGQEANKAKWKECIELAKAGNMSTIEDKYPYIYLMHMNKLLNLRIRSNEVLNELQHEWWVGESGTGKSREFWAKYGEGGFYFKQLNKWWDGYQDEDVVLIEEINPTQEYLAHHMKIWCDRYPFSGEIKGGMLRGIRPKKIVVLSNYEIEQCFTRIQDSEPMKRRFKVKRFYSFFNTVDEVLQVLDN